MKKRQEAAAKSAALSSKKQKMTKWAAAHACALESRGLDWWVSGVPDSTVLSRYKGLCGLTERQHDLLRIYGVTYPDRRNAAIELSQNLRGTSVRTIRDNWSDIVTPKGQLLLTARARLVTGRECMLMQGIHYGDEDWKLDYLDEDHDLLRSLAGNAFNTFCAGAAYITKQVLEAHLTIQAKLRRRQPTETDADMEDLFQFT